MVFLEISQAYNFIKKETLVQVFSCEFCEISKNTAFTEQVRMTASVFLNLSLKICPTKPYDRLL